MCEWKSSAHFSGEFCGSPVAQASACVVLIWVGAEKSTQTEVCATRVALALRLNSTQRVGIPEPTPWGQCGKCGLVQGLLYKTPQPFAVFVFHVHEFHAGSGSCYIANDGGELNSPQSGAHLHAERLTHNVPPVVFQERAAETDGSHTCGAAVRSHDNRRKRCGEIHAQIPPGTTVS